MTASRIWTAALIVIGDEILSGRTQDKNIAQIATWLQVQGIRLAEVRVIADDMDAIAEAVNILRARNDYLFTTGGIGPTHDDITVDAIAARLVRVLDAVGNDRLTAVGDIDILGADEKQALAPARGSADVALRTWPEMLAASVALSGLVWWAADTAPRTCCAGCTVGARGGAACTFAAA